MSLKIYYAHTGDCLVVDPESFNSVDDLKLWISEQINVPPQNQILTTVKGLLVRPQALSTEREFFLYSRQYILSSGSPSAPSFQVPALTEPQPFPSSLESQNDLGSWKTLFSHRVTWAQSVLAHADTLISSIAKSNISISIMERSVDVAANNLNTHVRSSIGEYDELRGWALEALRAQEKLLINWEPSLGKLGKVKVHQEVAAVVAQVRGLDKPRDRRSSGAQLAIETLLDLVNTKEVQNAGQALQALAINFEKQMTELGGKVEDVRHITNELEEAMHTGMKNAEDPNPEEPQYLLNDIAAVVQRVQQDYDHVCTLPNTPKSIASTSKTAHVHTRELLPSLVEMITDMSELRQRVAHRKNKVSQLCVQYLQRISAIERQLYEDLKYYMKEYETKYNEESTPMCQLLALVVYLPSRYSSFMVECVRRREWSERMKADGSKLAEELAGLKEEEDKRRKKWYKSTTQGGGLSLEFLPEESTASGINVELSVQSDSNSWPKITREDLAELLENLKTIPGTESAIKDLAQQIIDLDKPSRRQRKAETPTLATRAFKMGSVHEAAMGNSGFPQGDADDATKVQILQAERAKWDAQVRTYESRIRKLEDLLHRARSTNTTTGIQFTQHGSSTSNNNSSQPPLSPATAEPLSRNPSQGGPGVALTGVNMPGMKRRISQVESIEKLAVRVQALETELVAEREMNAKLQEEAVKRANTEQDWSDRFAEADQTKRDLLANLDAQQQEFSSERKGLHEKNRDLEEQLDSWKRRVDELYVELDRTEEVRTEDLMKKQEIEKELDNAKAEAEKYKDMAFDHEEELAKAREEWDEQSKEAASTADRLLSEIFELRGARDGHNKVVVELNGEIATLKSAVEAINDAKAALEKKVSTLEDALKLEQDRHGKALEGHADALAPLKMSYERLSSVLGEAKKAPGAPKDLVEGIECLIGNLIDRHKSTKEKYATEEAFLRSMDQKFSSLTERFESRTLKARDLTQRLYTHNARCGQLLENLGFSVVLRDGSTQIVRIPRTTNGEPPAEMNHSISMSSTLPPLPDDRNSHLDLELLYWMQAEDSEIESEKYATYLNSIGALDIDAFCEAVRKRVKEAEHMARKWQKQARDYRDKYHRVQAEAGEKIAFKSFKEGDLALFLPTRNQITKPWAAFNVGAPHYFLREQDAHKLQARDWLLARISKIEERVVDLSKSTAGTHGTAGDRASINSSEGGASIDEENPFQLSDGLRWYLLDAAEEKPGAPTTPGLSSSTVASAHVDARGSLKSRKPVTGARKTLSKSLQQSGGPPPTTGENASIRSRGSAASHGRKDSGGVQSTSPLAPATPLPESTILDT